MHQKYSHTKKNGEKETWPEIAKRVAHNVLKAVDAEPELVSRIEKMIAEKKFMPGGRYLYASGRPFHQTQNPLAGETKVVTRYGTKEIRELAGKEPVLMTSGGKWVKAEVRSFGVQPLLKLTVARGKTVKELYATPEHSWRVAKNEAVVNGKLRLANKVSVDTQDLRSNDVLWTLYGYGISRTALSPAGIQHGIVFGDGNVPRDEWGFNTANVRLCGEKDLQLLKFFDGYKTRPIEGDIEVSGLPRHYKTNVSLEQDRSYLFGWLAGYFAADGNVPESGSPTISSTKPENLQLVKDVCYILGIGANPIRFQDRISNLTGEPSRIYSVSLVAATLTPEFFLLDGHRTRFLSKRHRKPLSWKVISVETTDRVEEVFCAVVPETHEFLLEDNILTGNCLLLRADDSREGWADLMQKATMALMTGAGIGVVYSDVRGEGKLIRRTGGFATGPIALMQMVNEAGRGIMQGGSRRSAIWAGLHWNHPDVMKFITLKNWSPEVRALKEKDYNFPATMDGTNISVILDDDFFKAFENEKNKNHSLAQNVYWATVRQMLKTAEPGFSVDVGENKGENLRNACTEITSRDDSDICNLGSINMAEINTLEEMAEVVELSTAFLLAGTVYSDVPYAKVDEIRRKNRRLGLGLLGLHEWLLKRGKKYDIDPELEKFLEIYAGSTPIAAKYAEKWNISAPIKTRAIAPTGTIGILAGTTTGIEPLFCVAYKRRYLKGNVVHYQYVVDGAAQRLIESGVHEDTIEDAYTLAEDLERRVAFQAWVQKFVDHSISSTINLPEWGSELNNDKTVRPFGTMLMKYLPKLRGMTVYPDGARGGQPLSPVKYSTAVKHVGEVFVEQADICDISKGGSCGT
jgi:ribonucleoside-diphosphate reductase alpha chain